VLELDSFGIAGVAEYSKGLIQDDSPSRLGKRCMRINRATSTIEVARLY
jgi:hypothetical protein